MGAGKAGPETQGAHAVMRVAAQRERRFGSRVEWREQWHWRFRDRDGGQRQSSGPSPCMLRSPPCPEGQARLLRVEARASACSAANVGGDDLLPPVRC
eukprot:scaffold14288_cov109-Isochrysis_galbana.AAC.3